LSNASTPHAPINLLAVPTPCKAGDVIAGPYINCSK
jgi:hypothetical protein